MRVSSLLLFMYDAQAELDVIDQLNPKLYHIVLTCKQAYLADTIGIHDHNSHARESHVKKHIILTIFCEGRLYYTRSLQQHCNCPARSWYLVAGASVVQASMSLHEYDQ